MTLRIKRAARSALLKKELLVNQLKPISNKTLDQKDFRSRELSRSTQTILALKSCANTQIHLESRKI
jgi:hypothetical protein